MTESAGGNTTNIPEIDSAKKNAAAISYAAILTFASLAILLYGRICLAGFTLDEFSHLGYCVQTFQGHTDALLSKLFGSWTSGKEDGIIAYRPVTCLTFVIDYFIWQTRVVGWHITNLACLVATSFFSGAILTELLRKAVSIKAAVVAGIISGLLMLVYPGHPDSVATIVGRVDLLPAMFYLASAYFYVLSRRIDNGKKYFSASLVLFWLALGSKEIAVTLPVILVIGELLGLIGSHKNESEITKAKKTIKETVATAFKQVLPFFIVLGAFALLRTVVLHGQVGGYGKMSLKAILKQLLNFGDLNTIMKILVPINEHYPMAQAFSMAMLGSYALAALNFITLMLKNKSFARVVAFFALFTIINVLLTFQIWHIYPNMVGARLFFLSSAGFCSLLATGFMLDARSKGMSFLNMCAAGFLTLVWSIVLVNNLQPFEKAARMMDSLQVQIAELAQSAGAMNEKIWIEYLPQDYNGAPMIGKPAFLAVMMQPPLAPADMRKHIIVPERFEKISAEEYMAKYKQPYKLRLLDALDEDMPTKKETVRVFTFDENVGHLVAKP